MANNDELANAAAQGDIGKVTQLLRNGADPNGVNSFGRTPIQVMKMGCPLICQLLLKHGADPNRQDNLQIALIHDVARDGFLDTLKILVEIGMADTNLRDNNNCLPIDLAKQNSHWDVVKYLDVRKLFSINGPGSAGFRHKINKLQLRASQNFRRFTMRRTFKSGYQKRKRKHQLEEQLK
ncbi:cyclin-dependent kinase 4 inhibitor B-like [Mustelus asterias]